MTEILENVRVFARPLAAADDGRAMTIPRRFSSKTVALQKEMLSDYIL